MTYTIMARSEETGEIGLAMTTVSIAAGGLCFFYTRRGDLITSQAYARAALGHAMAVEMERNNPPEQCLRHALEGDAGAAYRQLAILPIHGRPVAWTGSDCRPYAGHLLEEDLVIAGNVLAGPGVLGAMREGFRRSGRPLAECLIAALEAGRAAGGQATPEGRGLSERSAVVRVLRPAETAGPPVLDLRVDLHHSAVHELRRLYEIHKTYAGYARMRDEEPARCPSIVKFEDEALARGGLFAERPSCFR
ncbi:MAG: DUF1028 domain-containing protein [Alphaproteobacteria bacterium]|nr:DUF1028 domain-containing protein [Alphaproteobacteria bacterium]